MSYQVGKYQSDPETFEGMIEMADLTRTRLTEHLAMYGLDGRQIRFLLEIVAELEKWTTLAALISVEE